MSWRRAGLVTALAALSCAVLAAGSPAVARTSGDPAPTISVGEPTRGIDSVVDASGLAPGGSYVITSDVVTFGARRHRRTRGTADADGDLVRRGHVPARVPLTTTALTVSVRAPGSSTTLASSTVDIEPPFLIVGATCPGLGWEAEVAGLTRGTYLLHTGSGAYPDQQVVVGSDGRRWLDGRDLVMPRTFTRRRFRSELLDADGTVVATDTTVMSSPTLDVGGYLLGPGPEYVSGDCFAPGEMVSVTGPARAGLPRHLTADKLGHLSATVVHPTAFADPRDVRITAVGRVSDRRARTEFELAGTTLLPGQQVRQSLTGIDQLRSPDYDFAIDPYGAGPCGVALERIRSGPRHGVTARPVWQVESRRGTGGGRSCSLALRRSGDLELRGAGGHVWWHTATGHQGVVRATVTDGGALRLLTRADDVVWSSKRP